MCDAAHMSADHMASEPVRVCVYCGSNEGSSSAFAAAARQLGTALGNRGIGMVFGGGSVGLMGITADAAMEAGGEVTGVITQQLVGAEVAHRSLTELQIVATMHERKSRLCDLATGFIVLPGGFGTVDEFAEMLTWNQLGIIAKPVVLLDVAGYWAPLFEWMNGAVAAGFVRPAHRMIAQRARNVDEAIALATSPVPDTPHKWLDRDTVRP